MSDDDNGTKIILLIMFSVITAQKTKICFAFKMREAGKKTGLMLASDGNHENKNCIECRKKKCENVLYVDRIHENINKGNILNDHKNENWFVYMHIEIFCIKILWNGS